MQSNNSDNIGKKQELDQLIEALKECNDSYNKFTQPVALLQVELCKADAKNRDALNKKINFFNQELTKPEFKKLEEDIKTITKKIEELKIEIYGKSNRHSPGFLKPGK